MPRGGPRPGAGRPKEGYQGRDLYVSMTPNGWRRLERLLEALRGRYPYRARLLGLILLEGAEALHERVKQAQKAAKGGPVPGVPVMRARK